MIHEAVAVVTAISPGCVQTNHHLVPPSALAQVLREACQVAFGQPLQFSHNVLSLVHGVETVHPKHNLNLHLEGQHVAKRFVLRIDQPSAVHPDTVNIRQLTSPLDIPLLILLFPPILTSRQDLGSNTEKVYPWGVPPRVSSRVQSPHVMSLHQSRSLK